MSAAASSPLTVPHEAVPCPFCGSRMAYANLDGGVWFGVCAECFSASGPGADTPEDAMAQWNHRAEGKDTPSPEIPKGEAPADAGQPQGGTPAAAPKAASRSRRASGSPGGAPAKKARPSRSKKDAKGRAKAEEPAKEGGAE